VKELIIPKPIPLTLLEIGTRVEVTLINNVTHAYEIFGILYIVLTNTPIMERIDL
jgi:hypothetical protein